MNSPRPEYKMYTLHIYGSVTIRQRISDGYISGSDMCRVNDKRSARYLGAVHTKPTIDGVAKYLGLVREDILQTIPHGARLGTWVHPVLAPYFAQWVLPELAPHVSGWVYEWNVHAASTIEQLIIDTKQALKDLTCDRLTLKWGGGAQRNVVLPSGTANIVTNDFVIVVGEYIEYQHALGRALIYAYDLSKLGKKVRPCICLYGDGDLGAVAEYCIASGVMLMQ